ncbi:MAG: UDP-N-acetylglucosamine--N-acetylmuramyl-(pentapeptide) pyrophosphoryl-undecaprenol N-acetylglucosamine transferase [Phycisphaeraceae bacterium]|nr:UDP-N-acetylglucosamine--N-acetylmuramyl-(pentapeptide) pyrophosphoryl-undecaprenol N-acetylglucosamine transferase [Phycisphaeraceae bacterium]
MQRCTFIFAGGGTGGHLYPGLAIAQELEELAAAAGDRDAARCVFVCSNRPLDARILGAAGVEYVASPARPLSMRPLGLLRFAAGWGAAVRHARRTIAHERSGTEGARRVVVAAMGGFVAAPAVQAAGVERAPILMVNLDAAPGKANLWIAQRALRSAGCMTAAPVTHRRAQAWESIPPIVRREVLEVRDAAACKSVLGLDPARPVLMVTGGSQGARSLNEFVQSFAATPDGRGPLTAGCWQVLHQTGPAGDDAARATYAAAGVDAVVQPFTTDMGTWWGAADVAVARSGAGNVAEVWATRTPTLFLPYPFHKDEHQRHNARTVVEAGGAMLGRDRIDPAANIRENGPMLLRLLTDTAFRREMRGRLAGLGPADGATRVAQRLWEVGQTRDNGG